MNRLTVHLCKQTHCTVQAGSLGTFVNKITVHMCKETCCARMQVDSLYLCKQASCALL